MGIFVISPHAGLLLAGNIDLTARPVVKNRDGSISTVRSVGFDLPRSALPANIQSRFKGRVAQVLVPSVVGDRVVSDRSAWEEFANTGRHLGVFDSIGHSNAYAVALHNWQARYYLGKKKQKVAR